MSERWSRRNVIVTAVLGVLSIAAVVGGYFVEFGEEDIHTEVVAVSQSGDEEPRPRISISSIYVSETAMDIPAVFELAVQADSIAKSPARNVHVSLNFGRAEIEICDYTPKGLVKTLVDDDKSYKRLEITELRQSERLYIRCLISTPTFEKVIIDGGNLHSGISTDFASYRQSLESGGVSFWGAIWRAVVVLFIVLFCLKAIGIMFRDRSV